MCNKQVYLSYVAMFSTLHAYVLYPNEQAAVSAFENAKSNPVQLDGRHLIIQHYKPVPKHVLSGSYCYCYYLW